MLSNVNAVLIVGLIAGGAAAQITAFPDVKNSVVVNAIDPDDPEYQVCSAADELIGVCIEILGGEEGFSTADPDLVVACVCCGTDGTAIAPAYSVCSSYLSEEAPQYTADYSAYGDIYTVCSISADFCLGPTSSLTGAATRTTLSIPSTTSSSSSSSSPTSSSRSASTTRTSTTTAEPPECTSMVDLFVSCSSKDPEFTDLPFIEQAPCYCCTTSLGTIIWTDELDEYAQTCSSWAITGDPDTIYPVARTLASFCDNFSDVCDSLTFTSPPDTTATTTSIDPQSTTEDVTGGVTVTETVTPSATEDPNQTDAGSTVHVSCGAAVMAIAMFAILF